MEEKLWGERDDLLLTSLWTQQTSRSEFKELKETERRRRSILHCGVKIWIFDRWRNTGIIKTTASNMTTTCMIEKSSHENQ